MKKLPTWHIKMLPVLCAIEDEILIVDLRNAAKTLQQPKNIDLPFEQVLLVREMKAVFLWFFQRFCQKIEAISRVQKQFD